MQRYVIRGGAAGYERLKVLARCWAPTTSALLDRVGPAPGMTCLDLGCGAGDVAFELARRVAPGGRVVGIDMDGVKLGLARRAAVEQGIGNIEFRTVDLAAWAEPRTYDLVYCRFVLEHLAHPVDALRVMWAAVRDGGAIAVEDADFEGSSCDPPNAGFAFWVEMYQRVLQRHGGDPVAGRKLFRYFTQAGIPPPELSTVQRADHSGEAKTLPYLTIEATAEAIIEHGLTSAEAIDVALRDLAEYAADPDTVVGSPRIVQAWSRRG